jgi:hypothetical protein
MNSNDNSWQFFDPPNFACITTRKIMEGEHYIDLVSHDEDDGCWQFLSSQVKSFNSADAMIVGLGELVSLDGTIVQLADLPLGWQATRMGQTGNWSQFPSSD